MRFSLTFYISFIFIVLLSFKSVASKTVDSLKLVYANASNTNSKADALIKICEAYYYTSVDTAMHFAQKAMQLTSTISDHFLKGRIYNSIGNIYVHQHRADSARFYYFKALDLFKNSSPNMDQKRLIAYTLSGLGDTYYFENELGRALEFYIFSEDTLKSIDVKIGLGSLYNKLSNIYYSLGNTEKDLDYNLKSYELFKEINDYRGQAGVLNNLGDIYKGEKDYLKAEEYILEAIRIKRTYNYTTNLAVSFITLGEVYNEMNRHSDAVVYLKKALESIEQSGSHVGHAIALLELGKAYYKLGDFKLAESKLSAALEMAVQQRYKLQIKEILFWQIKTEKELGNLNKALLLYDEYTAYSDSISQAKNSEILLNLKEKYEVEQTIKENERLKLELAKEQVIVRNKKLQIYVFSLVLVLLLSMLVVAAVFYNNKNKTNKILSKQNELINNKNLQIEESNAELNASNKQLEQLMDQSHLIQRMIVHDLKTPISNILGFTGLLKEKLKNKNSEEELDYTNRISQLAVRMNEMVISIMSAYSDNHTREKRFNINELLASDLVELKQLAGRKNIEIDFQPKNEIIARINPVLFSHVFENLVTNAIKYSNTETKIVVGTQIIGINFILWVRDQGMGLTPSEIELLFSNPLKIKNQPTAGESSTGMGLKIVETLVQKLQGHIEVESVKGEGTKFTCTFPILT